MACACKTSMAAQKRVRKRRPRTTTVRRRVKRARQIVTPTYGYSDAGGGTDVLMPQGRIGQMSATTLAGSALANNYLGGGRLSFAPYAASVLPVASVKALAAAPAVASAAAVAAAQRRYRRKKRTTRRR